MAYGDLGSELDRLEYDTVYGAFSDIIKVADGVVAVFNSSETGGLDGTVRTYPIAEDGTIGALIDSWEFVENYFGSAYRYVIEVATGIFLFAYMEGAYDYRIATIAIAADGTITKSFIDSVHEAAESLWAMRCLKRRGTSNVFAMLKWHGTSPFEGRIKTYTCDSDGTNVAVVNSYDYATTGYLSQMAHITGDVFAVLSYDGSDAIVKTVLVDSSGNITAAIQDSQVVASGALTHGDIMPLGGDDLVVVAYRMSAGGSVLLATMTINSAGAISAIIDSKQQNDANSTAFLLKSLGVSSGTYYFMVGFSGTNQDDGIIITWSSDSSGTLAAIRIDELVVFENTFVNWTGAVQVRDSLWCFCWVGPGNDGYISAVDVSTVPLYADDGIYVTIDGTEIQAKCLSARSERGRDEELGQAQTGILELTCDNSGGDFSPENVGGDYYGTLVLGAELKLYEIYQDVTYEHFTGKIDKILPHAEWDNRVAYIVALDGMDDLAGTEIKTVLRTDTETGELCDDILDAVDWPSGAASRDIDTGIDVLQYGWFHKVKGLEGIRMLERIEKGFFYVDVDGKAVWENRHRRITGDGLVSQADFEDTMVEVGYEYSKRQVKNQVTVKGRRYFSGGVTLWSGYDLATLDDDLIWSAHCGDSQAPYIPQATTVTLWAEWNAPLASSTALVKGTHWDANTKADKTGVDVGASITITETAYGQAIKLVIENAGSVGAYLVVPDSPPVGAPADRTLLIYGVLFGEENITITKDDDTSKTAYGVRSLDLDAPFKSNPNDILAMAEYLLARFKDPVPDAVSVRFAARTAYPADTIRVQCLTRKISDRVTLKATLHGFDRDFFINKVIQDYILKEGGFVHQTTWYVERAEGAYEHLFWLLGVVGFGELGEATYLGV